MSSGGQTGRGRAVIRWLFITIILAIIILNLPGCVAQGKRFGHRIMIMTSRHESLAPLGKPFQFIVGPVYEIPDKKAVSRVHEPNDRFIDADARRLLKPDNGDRDIDLWSDGLESEMQYFGSDKETNKICKLPTGYSSVIRFLHMSDAQIRDERFYSSSRKDFRNLDKFISSTIRPHSIESWDAVVFAVFITAYGKQMYKRIEEGKHRSAYHPFIVHTGDLIDISTDTELAEANWVLSQYLQGYSEVPFYSVAGNHDGLTFGTLADQITNTRGHGINKNEFVLGSIVADPANGFGFKNNENLLAVWGKGKNDVPEKQRDVAKATRNIDEVWYERDATYQENNAHDLRQIAHVGKTEDSHSRRLGYYSWVQRPATHLRPDRPGAENIPTLRCIVLDTRTEFLHEGTIDDRQVIWLYNELVSALHNQETALIFSHHRPDHLEFGTTGKNVKFVVRMMDRFPHIAAAFYGHTHDNAPAWTWPDLKSDDPGIVMFETGSILDFPQVAREVEIRAKQFTAVDEPSGWDIQFAYAYVYPQASSDSDAGQFIRRTMECVLSDAEKDAKTPRSEPKDPSSRAAKEYRGEDVRRNKVYEKTYLAPCVIDTRIRFPAISLEDGVAGLRTLGLAPNDIFGDSFLASKPEDLTLPSYHAIRDAKGVFSELSGIRIHGDYSYLAGDESRKGLWRYRSNDGAVQWCPIDSKKEFSDIESLAHWDDRSFFAICSLSLNSNEERKKNRNRVALLKTNKSPARNTELKVVFEVDFRDEIVKFLDNAVGPNNDHDTTLNIEGAAVLGGRLVLGLKTPRSSSNAILVPIEKTQQWVDSEGALDVEFGHVSLLPLGNNEAIAGMCAVGESLFVLTDDESDDAGKPDVPARILKMTLENAGASAKEIWKEPECWMNVPGTDRRSEFEGIDFLGEHGGKHHFWLVRDQLPPDYRCFAPIEIVCIESKEI